MLIAIQRPAQLAPGETSHWVGLAIIDKLVIREPVVASTPITPIAYCLRCWTKYPVEYVQWVHLTCVWEDGTAGPICTSVCPYCLVACADLMDPDAQSVVDIRSSAEALRQEYETTIHYHRAMERLHPDSTFSFDELPYIEERQINLP